MQGDFFYEVPRLLEIAASLNPFYAKTSISGFLKEL
jgi:hypothetical protein